MGGNVLFILYLFLIEVLFLARPRLVGWLGPSLGYQVAKATETIAIGFDLRGFSVAATLPAVGTFFYPWQVDNQLRICV